jgi:uncharacterized protein YaaR (DUF327 family)
MSDTLKTYAKVVKLFKRKTDSMQFKAKSYVQGKLNQHHYHSNKANEQLKGFLNKMESTGKRKLNTNVVRPIKKFMGSIK